MDTFDLEQNVIDDIARFQILTRPLGYCVSLAPSLLTLTEITDQGNDPKDGHHGHDTRHPQSRNNDFFHRFLRN